MSRPATPEEKDTIRCMKPQDDCRPGEVECPFYSKRSSMWKFCAKNGKDCPVNGLIHLDDGKTLTQENYRKLLVDLIQAHNEGLSSEFERILRISAKVVGMEVITR